MAVADKNSLESFANRKDELFSFYDAHTYKDTLREFGISSYRKLRSILESLGYDFAYKRSHSVMKSRPASVSHEMYLERGRKSSETQKRTWESKSDDEKTTWSEKQKVAHSSKEYRDAKSKSQKEWYASLDENGKKEYAKVREEGSKKYWSSLSDDEKDAKVRKSIEAGAGWNHERIRNTLRSKYGVDNVSQIDEVKRKAVEGMNRTCLEKHGVDWNCQLSQCVNSIGAHSSNTKPNLEFARLLDANGIAYEREFVVGKFVYDFKVDDTLIEINPTATHNSTWSPFSKPIDKLYHKDKMVNAENNGYRCIMVWDWDSPEKIVRSLLGSDVLYARKCKVVEIDRNVCSEFVDEYHFQNDARSSVRLGLYSDDELVSVMTFGKPRYNRKYDWELIRYCSSKSVVGGAKKLFSYFVRKYEPKSIVSYCDRSKFTGKLYADLNFERMKSGQPSKHWYRVKTKEHYTDNLIRQQGFSRIVHRVDASKDNLDTNDNNALMISEGFAEVWDCGQDTYVWENDKFIDVN